MKRITYIGLAVFAWMVLASCHKYLDIVPKGKIIPTKTSDYRLLLNQINKNGSSNGFVNSFSNDLLMGDDMQINAFSAGFYSPADLNVWMFAEHIYQDAESDPDWEALYNQIYVSNLVINQVMDSEAGTQAEKQQLMAEARVHRAYAFLILVNLYAKQYDPATAATDPGVPLRTELDFQESLERASVQQVYDFILDDLTQALGHLPDQPTPDYNYRPVEAAANALLARTNLYMNNIEEAFKYSDASIELYHELIDYNTLPPGALFPGTLGVPMGLKNKEVLLLKSVVSNASLFYADDQLISLYDLDNDLRSTAMFANDALLGLSFGYICAEWSGRVPVKGPTVGEMYLTRAECYARMDKPADAMNDLNTLRSFRYKTGSDYELSATTGPEALTLVKAERRRELAFKGFRWFDIRRYNVFDNDHITVTHLLNGSTYTLEPGSPRTALPIARKYIDLNPEIVPNPR